VGGIEDASDAARNDPRDPDSGPNGLQDKPIITSAITASDRTASGKTTVRGSLVSTPKRTFTLRLFSDVPGDEGKTSLAKKFVTTNAEGDAPFAFSPGAALPAGRVVRWQNADRQTRW
jgi:hypothetical protein